MNISQYQLIVGIWIFSTHLMMAASCKRVIITHPDWQSAPLTEPCCPGKQKIKGFLKGFPGLSFVQAIYRTPWHKDCSDKVWYYS